MRTLVFPLFCVFLLLFSTCTRFERTPDFDPECIELAEQMAPSEVSLSFYENNDNPDAVELSYFLEGIVWNDKSTSFENRGYQKKQSGGDKSFYYPFDRSTNTNREWPSTKEIFYEGKINDTSVRFVYEFVLSPTDDIVYREFFDSITKKFTLDYRAGRRTFNVEELNIKECIMQKN